MKSFKEFLNEFEIEGEHQENKSLLKELTYIHRWFNKQYKKDIVLSTSEGNFIRTNEYQQSTKSDVYRIINQDNNETVAEYEWFDGTIAGPQVYKPNVIDFIYKLL